DWQPRAVRASDMPPGGLDSARLRFELVAPGILWLDDLRIAGEMISKSERENARRTLLAALRAYREERYADFARLAASHWTRQSSPPAASRRARATDHLPKPGTGGTRAGDGAASALPPDRKLR